MKYDAPILWERMFLYCGHFRGHQMFACFKPSLSLALFMFAPMPFKKRHHPFLFNHIRSFLMCQELFQETLKKVLTIQETLFIMNSTSSLLTFKGGESLMQTTFGTKIKSALIDKGMTQRHLAKKTNIKYSTLNNMLNGRKVIDAYDLLKIIDVLGITANEVFDITPDHERR